MRKKLSVLFTVLIGSAMAVGASSEQLKAGAASAVVPVMIAPTEKPGAPIDHLLEAHNRYLEQAGKPDLRAPRSPECAGAGLVRLGPIDLADRR